MSRTPIKILISDVDGTLVTSGRVLTSHAREAVERLRSAGIQFTITSSRPPRGMAMLSEALTLDDFSRQWSAVSGKAFVWFEAVHDYQLYVDGKLRIEGARSFLQVAAFS